MNTDRIQLAHGGGGQLTTELITEVIVPILGGQDVAVMTDAAVLDMPPGRVALTTDSYVVQPLEFPGGDIGKLAVCGTVNDLSVCGAIPVALTMGLVLQEGLEIARLKRVLSSAAAAAETAGVRIVTGDTKVVGRDACDGMTINTAGVGTLMPAASLGFDHIAAGDRVIVSGPLGEHGLAVMSKRKGLSFTAELESDCAPLNELTTTLVESFADEVRFMRDPTRGGLAATLAEISTSANVDVEIVQASIPVNRTVRAAGEMLGLDLMTVANEGKLVTIVAPDAAEQAVAILRKHAIAREASIIGTIVDTSEHPIVELVTKAGGRRVIQMPYGEQLPRIC